MSLDEGRKRKRAAWQKEWREKNPRRKQYEKEWREKNRQRIKKQKVEYYLKNKERIQKRTQSWRAKPEVKANNTAKRIKYLKENLEKTKAQQKKYYEEHKEHLLKKGKEWRISNADRKKCSGLRKRYGITLAERNDFIAAQNHCCRCCRKRAPENPGRYWWNIDHCHDTGDILGLVCRRCNTLKGQLGDKKESIATYCGMLIKYIDLPPLKRKR